MALSGQARRGPRSSHSGVRLVHRGLRYARSEEAKALLDELAACFGLRKSPRGPTSSLPPKLREIRGPRDFSVIPRSEFARELKLKRPPRRTWRLGGCCLSLGCDLTAWATTSSVRPNPSRVRFVSLRTQVNVRLCVDLKRQLLQPVPDPGPGQRSRSKRNGFA